MLATTAPATAAAASGPTGGFGGLVNPLQSRCEGMSVASHIVFIGHDIVGHTTPGVCGSAPRNTWTWAGPLGGLPGPAVSGCGNNATSCAVKADASTNNTWTVLCINGSDTQQGSWESCDYYGVPDEGVGVIEGHVTDQDGSPVAGVDVTAYGKHRAGAVSGPDGFYAMQAKPGSYQVRPSGGPQGQSAPSYNPSVRNATVANGSATTANFQLVGPPVRISGTVTGVSCAESGCSLSGLSGEEILVTGTSRKGAEVSKLVTSGAKGLWSAKVPAGVYSVGPTLDGVQIDGTGFDPDEYHNVRVGTGGVPGKNFMVCVSSASTAAVTNGQRRLAAAGTAVPETSHGGLTAVSLCRSDYAVSISAKIPQAMLIDPSLLARYNTGSGAGYNTTTAGLWGLVSSNTYRRLLRLAPEYPACPSFTTVEVSALTQEGVKAVWYSSIVGGSLGSLDVTLQWNQSTQEVHVVSGPTATTATLTRRFTYQLTWPDGKVIPGSCDQQVEVPVIATAIGGADGTPAPLTNRDFAVVLVWGFPFDAPGAQIDPTGTLVSAMLHYTNAAAIAHEVGEAIENAPAALKAAFEGLTFVASYGVGSGLVAAVTKSGDFVTGFLYKASKLSAAALQASKAVGSAAEWAHHYHTGTEIWGMLKGLLGEGVSPGEGAYPLMAALVRGQFTTQYRASGANKTPKSSTLAVSVETTRFPNISVQISRQALGSTDPKKPVYSGKALPWSTGSLSTVGTSNPFSFNPPYLVNDSTKNGKYASGETAVRDVEADTSQLPQVTGGFRKYGELDTNIAAELSEAPVPLCGPKGKPKTLATICWVFSDGRP